MATEDLCLVCADTLDWTGIGPCGHKEVCSRCVARVRFVMEDSKCMICKQDNPQVYFTRYMGDYTERPQDFAQQHLLSRAQQGELYELPEVNGFFDDQDHYKYIKALCSYTHPLVMGATFGTLSGLKRRLQEQQKLHFCDLCIKGRKVFISEQVLYSKPDLEKHLRTGDDTGPMAESGFKGHPLCRFCKQRFYDGDELYKHMEGRHEHCFICRKHHPNKFVYYKDYAELEDHFQTQHHPCPHPACLERKFVVFLEEAELKRHFATEHGSDMNMSRAQRRQALAINIQLNYSREQEAAIAAAQRPGVVIGGGHNLPRRGGGMRHSRSDGAMAAAVQASLESGQVESALRQSAAEAQPGSVTFSAEDFPSVSGQGGPGTAPLGTWLGASSSGQSASLTQDDFPALPSMSRNQRKKQRERERLTAATLAGRLAAANAPIRVVNRTSAAGPSSGASGAAAAAADSAAASSSGASGLVRHSSSTGNLASASSTQAAGADSDDDATPAAADDFPALGGGSGGAAATQAHPAWVPVRRARPPRPGQAGAGSRAAAAPPSISDFPSLAAAAPASGRTAAKAPSSAGAGGKARAGSSSSAGAAPAAVSVAAAVSAAGGVSEELKAANKALIERCKAILSEEGFRDFREQSAAFMQGAVAAGDYHEQVVHLGLLSLVPQLAALCPDPAKRAALVAAHKAHLGAAAADADGSAGPAPASSSRGWVPPEAAMAALQEVEQRGSWACERCTLVNAPNSRACEVCSAPRPKAAPAASGSGAATGAAAAGKPPSPAKPKPQQQQWGAAAAGPGPAGSSAAAVVAAGLRQASPARAAAGSASSSAASSPPPPVQRGSDAWPSLAGPSGSSSSSSAAAGSSSSQQQPEVQQQQQPQPQQDSKAGGAGGKGGKGGKSKGTKTSLQELLASGRSHPQNAWSQQQRKEQITTPAAPSGQWKAGGGAKLAKKIGAVNDAWSK